MDDLITVKQYVCKIIDYAYAISLDEKNDKMGLALTMADSILECGQKIMEILNSENPRC